MNLYVCTHLGSFWPPLLGIGGVRELGHLVDRFYQVSRFDQSLVRPRAIKQKLFEVCQQHLDSMRAFFLLHSESYQFFLNFHRYIDGHFDQIDYSIYPLNIWLPMDCFPGSTRNERIRSALIAIWGSFPGKGRGSRVYHDHILDLFLGWTHELLTLVIFIGDQEIGNHLSTILNLSRDVLFLRRDFEMKMEWVMTFVFSHFPCLRTP